MKRITFVLFFLIFQVALLSQMVNEVEPNGCITLVGGNDSYQTLSPPITLSGSISTSDDEGCLYFEYPGVGNEYIEDLYLLEITHSGYYQLTLYFSGETDIDLYLMDENLNVLNSQSCGQFYCGVTCGEPESMNAFLSNGNYILGVSIASVYNCFTPNDSNYFLTIVETNPPLLMPEVTSMAKATNPFRLFIFGENLGSISKVYISGTEWFNYSIKGEELIKLKKGKPLKSMFPKDGSWVPITFVNSLGQSTTLLYNRYYNLWKSGGMN